MTYETFLNKLKQKLDSHEYSDTWTYQFYPDGFTSQDEEELELIHLTNLKYHNTESDVLIGDFLVMRNDYNNSTGVCRFDLNYLYNSCNKASWEFVKEVITENIKLSDNSQSDVIEHLRN
jgi:hypothetical protein